MWWQSHWTMPAGGDAYSEIWAAERFEAGRVAGLYGFDAPIRFYRAVPEFRPSKLAELDCGLARSDVLHSLCYLSTLAGRAGLAAAEELVGDGSPLHELSHYLGAGPNIRAGRMRPIVMERIGWLEGLLPGMPPGDLVLAPPKAIGDVGRLRERSGACPG